MIDPLEATLPFDSDDPLAMMQQARALFSSRKFLSALKILERLMEAGHVSADVWRLAGVALLEVGEFAQAIGALQKSLELESDTGTEYELARAAFRMGHIELAKVILSRIAQRDNLLDAWMALAKIIPGIPSADAQEILHVRRQLSKRLNEGQDSGLDMQAATPSRRDGRIRKLRIGYLSSFFDSSNYMKPVWGLINHHDRSQFEIHLFADLPTGFTLTGYHRHPADSIHKTERMDCAELARFIADMEIDVLVDLNGYSDGSRLPLFNRRLAPIVIAWFNMYATSGFPGFDYLIGDREVLSSHEEAHYCEKVLYLPISYLTFEVGHKSPPVVRPPCLPSGKITFGSLIAQYKMTSQTLDLWAEILRRCPYSPLLLANRTFTSSCNRDFVVNQFADRGISQERLMLLPPTEHYEFLQYYDQIDIALDAFPYNGGTTTMEAIWQGVPVLTYDGDRWAARTSQSLLRRTHLDKFVAKDAESFVDMAEHLAHDQETPVRLSTLRQSMRENLLKSSVTHVHELALGMERLLVQVFHAATSLPAGNG